jgi:hypothetical protein
MTAAGFDWSYQPQNTEAKTQAAAPKSQRKADQMKKVMDLAAKGRVTLAGARKILKENVQRTSYILRELTLEGKLTKTGRGKTAKYNPVANNKR